MQDDWSTMMQTVFNAIPSHETTQIIVNLGMVHKNSEVDVFWWDWLQWMRTDWRFYGWYVWNKPNPVPQGSYRLTTAHEWLFHFSKQSRQPNKIIAKQPHSISRNNRSHSLREPSGDWQPVYNPESYLNTHKIPTSVITTHTERSKSIHPARFPVKLPQTMIEAFTNEQEIVFDPFAGSATTIVAAHRTNRTGYGIELSSEYGWEALRRLEQETQREAVNQHGQTLKDLQ